MVFVSLVLIPKGASLVTGVESPALVVISGSMEPAIKKVVPYMFFHKNKVLDIQIRVFSQWNMVFVQHHMYGD